MRGTINIDEPGARLQSDSRVRPDYLFGGFVMEGNVATQAITEFQVQSESIAPQDKWEKLMQLAIERGAGAEQFAMLVDSMMKARKEDARLQFEAALGRFKEHLPEVLKTRKVVFPNRDGGQTSYSHAELDKAAEVVADELKKEGITFNWKPGTSEGGRTRMTCVFRHPVTGHVEEMATLDGPADTSGGKNNVQAIGSTTSYLQRYTLLAACGIVPKGMDNDGSTPTEGMPEDAITDYCFQMTDATKISPKDEKGTLQFIFAECYDKARKCADKEAEKRFIKVYEERKKALWQAK